VARQQYWHALQIRRKKVVGNKKNLPPKLCEAEYSASGGMKNLKSSNLPAGKAGPKKGCARRGGGQVGSDIVI